MPERAREAAQTVLRFALKEGRERFEVGAELIGESPSKEKLTFALDTEIEVSPAQISLVAIYHNRMMRLHHGTGLSKEFEEARPSFEAVPADLGPNPAIFMAIDVPDERHLSHHGCYFELTPEAKDLLAYLQREVWCLLDEQGEIRAEGMLRARPGNAGVRKLEWVAADSMPSVDEPSGPLPEGFYGGRVFIFPEVPAERRFLTTMPKSNGYSAETDLSGPWYRAFRPAPRLAADRTAARGEQRRRRSRQNRAALHDSVQCRGPRSDDPFRSGGDFDPDQQRRRAVRSSGQADVDQR